MNRGLLFALVVLSTSAYAFNIGRKLPINHIISLYLACIEGKCTVAGYDCVYDGFEGVCCQHDHVVLSPNGAISCGGNAVSPNTKPYNIGRKLTSNCAILICYVWACIAGKCTAPGYSCVYDGVEGVCCLHDNVRLSPSGAISCQPWTDGSKIENSFLFSWNQ